MYRLICGVTSRRNTTIFRPFPQRTIKRFNIIQIVRSYQDIQCNKYTNTSVNKYCSRSFQTTSCHNALPIWMLFTSHPLILSATVGRCLRWVLRDFPLGTGPEIVEQIIAKKYISIVLSVIVSSAVFYIYINGLQNDPITNRRRFIGLNKQQMDELAEVQSYDAMRFLTLSLPKSDPRYTRVLRIMKRLLSANEDLDNVREKDWNVYLIDAPYFVNALALHNGNVLVFSGMLQFCTTDDQLGFVLAHEIAHVLLLHLPERFSKLQLTDLILLLPLILIWTTMPFRDALVVHYLVMYVASLLIHLPFNRKLEYEADAVGLKLAAKACFDVRDASVFWHKIRSLLWVSDGKPIEWISTHPGTEARRKQIDSQMSKAIDIRDKNQCPKLSPTDPRIAISKATRLSSE